MSRKAAPPARGVKRTLHRPTLTPGVPCPKCGFADGWDGPRYKAGATVAIPNRELLDRVRWNTICTPECLVYSCPNCSYTRAEECCDAHLNSAKEPA